MTIFNSLNCVDGFNKGIFCKAMENIDINKLIKKAKLTKPIPMAKPMDIAKKIKVISRLLPGTDRKRTKEKAPTTATPVPRFPFTIMITNWTKEGKIASVNIKLREATCCIR